MVVSLVLGLLVTCVTTKPPSIKIVFTARHVKTVLFFNLFNFFFFIGRMFVLSHTPIASEREYVLDMLSAKLIPLAVHEYTFVITDLWDFE